MTKPIRRRGGAPGAAGALRAAAKATAAAGRARRGGLSPAMAWGLGGAAGLLLWRRRERDRMGPADEPARPAAVRQPVPAGPAGGGAPAPVPPDPDEEAAWRLFDERRYVDALAAFDAVLARAPASAGALQGRIGCLRLLGRIEAAHQALDAAQRLHPDAPGLMAERGWLAVVQKRPDQALAAFDAVMAAGHVDAGLLLWKAALLRGSRRYAEAEAVIDEARIRFPASPRPAAEAAWTRFHRGLYEDALAAFDRVLADFPQEASAWQGRIAALRRLERYAEAEDAAILARRACGGAPGILIESGWIAFDRGQYARAEGRFAEAVAAAPNEAPIRTALALALMRQGGADNLTAAADACRDALQLDPFLGDAHNYLGVIAFQRGAMREAEFHLTRTTEVDPQPQSHTDLGALALRLGRNDEARTRLEAALAIDPGYAPARIQLGRLLLEEGQERRALDEFRRALAADRSAAEAHRALALGLAEAGRLEEAETTLHAALREVHPSKSFELHLAMTQVLVRLYSERADDRRLEDALSQVSSALALRRDDARAHFALGFVLFKLGELRKSLSAFDKCLSLDPRHALADLNRMRVTAMLKNESKLVRAGKVTSVVLGVVTFLQLVGIWAIFLTTDKIKPALFVALLPVLLGLLIVTALLPWLSRLKLTGLEAELSVPKPKETLATGLRGEVGFGPAGPRS